MYIVVSTCLTALVLIGSTSDAFVKMLGRRANGCKYGDLQMEDGATHDQDSFRLQCTDGKASFIGCLLNGKFFAIGSELREEGSAVAYKCLKQDMLIQMLRYYTHCQYKEKVIEDNAEFDVDDFRYRCVVADHGAGFTLKLIGCLYKKRCVPINTSVEIEGTNYAFNCTLNGSKVSGRSYFTHCKFDDKLIEDGAKVASGYYRFQCELKDGGYGGWAMKISDCLFKTADQATVIKEVPVGQTITTSFNGQNIMMQCEQLKNGSVLMTAKQTNERFERSKII